MVMRSEQIRQRAVVVHHQNRMCVVDHVVVVLASCGRPSMTKGEVGHPIWVWVAYLCSSTLPRVGVKHGEKEVRNLVCLRTRELVLLVKHGGETPVLQAEEKREK